MNGKLLTCFYLISTDMKLYPTLGGLGARGPSSSSEVDRNKGPYIDYVTLLSLESTLVLDCSFVKEMDCATPRAHDLTSGMKPGRFGLCGDAACQRQLDRMSSEQLM